jgi:preprotein translocase subunit YajC
LASVKVMNSATRYFSAKVQVATVNPVVTSSTTIVLATATTLIFKGVGFSTTGTNNVVTLSSGRVTAVKATPTKLTITVNSLLGGVVNASIATNGVSSNITGVQIATVKPVVTPTATTHQLATATSVTINGDGFTTGTTVTLSSGTVGTVTVVSAHQLTVAVTKLLAGSLTASVVSSGVSSGTAEKVATVAPVVTPSGSTTLTAKGATAQTLTINGYGFTTGTTVILIGGTVGTVKVVSSNQLTVSVTNLVAGLLAARVTSSTVSSGTTAVQVATVVPAITPNTTTSLPGIWTTSTTLTIDGYGFSTTAGNNSVILTFGNGSTVTITATTATATKLTVKRPGVHPLGLLRASVTTDGLYNSDTVQVATVL